MWHYNVMEWNRLFVRGIHRSKRASNVDFWCFFDASQTKLLNKHLSGQWSEMPRHSCDITEMAFRPAWGYNHGAIDSRYIAVEFNTKYNTKGRISLNSLWTQKRYDVTSTTTTTTTMMMMIAHLSGEAMRRLSEFFAEKIPRDIKSAPYHAMSLWIFKWIAVIWIKNRNDTRPCTLHG